MSRLSSAAATPCGVRCHAVLKVINGLPIASAGVERISRAHGGGGADLIDVASTPLWFSWQPRFPALADLGISGAVLTVSALWRQERPIWRSENFDAFYPLGSVRRRECFLTADVGAYQACSFRTVPHLPGSTGQLAIDWAGLVRPDPDEGTASRPFKRRTWGLIEEGGSDLAAANCDPAGCNHWRRAAGALRLGLSAVTLPWRRRRGQTCGRGSGEPTSIDRAAMKSRLRAARALGPCGCVIQLLDPVKSWQ